MKTAWFLFYFWASMGSDADGWFSSGGKYAAAVQQARRPYDTREECVKDIPRVAGTFNATPKPGEVGFVCIEGVLR